jgi:hypothetical protein
MKGLLHTLGPLRCMLLVLVLGVIALAPFSEGPVRYEGWGMVPTLLAPVAFATLMFVLPLDITLSFAFMSAKEGAERARHWRVIRIEAVLFLVMMGAWTPFLVGLTRAG